MRDYQKFSLKICTIILSLALGMAIIGSFGPKEKQFTGNLEQLLPRSGTVGDWSMTHLQISETTEVKAMVDELINYDDAVYVRFSRDDWWIDVYIAYWKPGKMSYRAIAGHTPDVCWVGQGWNCQLREVKQMIPKVEETTPKLPMQYRVYTMSEKIVHVIFCHIVDGEVMFYQTADGIPPWYSMFSDLWNRGLWQKKEQTFIRISSNRVLNDFRNAPPIEKLLENIVMTLFAVRTDISEV
jgi:hypothetical protein